MSFNPRVEQERGVKNPVEGNINVPSTSNEDLKDTKVPIQWFFPHVSSKNLSMITKED